MDQRNNGRRPADLYSDSRNARQNPPRQDLRGAPRPDPRNRTSYPPDEIDRYNSVDRDVYSRSGPPRRSAANAQRGTPRRKKKRGRGGRVLIVFVSVLLLLALSGLAYSAVMFSRLDRSGGTGAVPSNYVQQPSGAPAWDVKTDDSVTNILLLGVDENDDKTDGRSDSDMLVSIDSKTKTLHMVSFLRDTYLEIPTVGKDKLNAAYAAGGAQLTMQTLENNYRINIDKYVAVDFNSFAAVIDQMGGLDVPMSQATCDQENENMGTHLKAGTNHLSGKLCLYYARIRHATDSFGHDDYGRAARQRQVLQLMIQKVKSMNPVAITKLMYDFLPDIGTNLSDTELVQLASVGATVSGYKTESQQIPADNTFTEPKINGADVIQPDLTKNCEILRQFLYGDTSEAGSAASSAG